MKHEQETAQPAPLGQVERGVGPVAEARRFGRFTAPAEWAHQFRTELKRVMGQCIVFRAEHMFHSDRIEYWAASEHFRHVPLGEIVPEYRWHFTDAGDMWCEEVNA
jgi:hypothetical protein